MSKQSNVMCQLVRQFCDTEDGMGQSDGTFAVWNMTDAALNVKKTSALSLKYWSWIDSAKAGRSLEGS